MAFVGVISVHRLDVADLKRAQHFADVMIDLLRLGTEDCRRWRLRQIRGVGRFLTLSARREWPLITMANPNRQSARYDGQPEKNGERIFRVSSSFDFPPSIGRSIAREKTAMLT